nr:MAG TPA: Terminase large subunit [Crassvirales sp.]
MILLPTNEFQTPITEELRDSLPTEVWDDFMDIITNTEFIKSLISPERKRAKDLPRDSYGRIIVDVCHPHILENMDYFRQSAIYFQKYGCYTKLLPNPNPKSEFGMWLTREVTRCLEGMVRPEDGEWIPGDMYFYLNYFPIIQTKLRKGSKIGDRVVDFPEFWEGVYLRFHYLNQARNGGIYDDFVGAKHAVEIASRGRAIEVNELVETPERLKLWKDIKIGDYLFGNYNTITKVVNIPFVGESPCYKITLRDGRTITASDNHIWNVYKRNSKKPILKTTLELFNEYKHSHKISSRVPKGIEYIYSIPSNEGVEFKEDVTQIDPYTFGLLLGDGCFKHLSCYYTCETTDFDIIKQYIPYQYTKWKDKYAYRIHIPNWRTLLKFYKLVDKGSEDKFIPREFKYNSRKVRLSLLQGLMDTDGYVSTEGIPIFTTVSEFLCQDIMWLARSLGYNCSFKKHPAGYKKDGIYKRCKDVYIVKIYGGPEVFKLPRKSNLVNYKSNYAKSRRDSTRIINIEFVGNKQCKCVTVDALDDSFLIGDFIQTHNSKSYSIAAIMCKMFLLGESMTSLNKVKCTIVADQKEFLIKDGSLNKFVDGIDFCSKYTQFPKARLKNSLSEMQWVSGYLDKETNIPKGTQNEVLGIAIKDDADKTRGKRSQRLFYEEFGTFPKFLDVWQTSLPNVQEGNVAFGLAYAIGTGGSEGSDFMGALEMINYPDGYNVYSLPNVYDKGSVGAKRTIFFFPSYMNSKGFYNEDGVSDVVGAIIDELKFRIKLKYNSSDPIQLTRRKAEYAFTITDAIMRRDSNIFPSDMLNDRILELDQNPKSLDDMWVGRLIQTREGKVEFTPDADIKPILDYPHKDNKIEGAIHINKMPVKGSDGKVPWGRYISGADVYDDDVSDTMSLGSIYVLDLFTDELVCEYTGRPMFADDFYETCRRICLFYNAELLYENNKKGLFTYFAKTNSLYLLSEVPEFLKDKEIVKGNFFGNKARGVNATQPVQTYGRKCIRDWLLKPFKITTKVTIDEHEEEAEITINSINRCYYRALMKELSMWNPDSNFDRYDALLMLMLLREQKLMLCGNQSPSEVISMDQSNYLGNDDFFTRNYDYKFAKYLHKDN